VYNLGYGVRETGQALDRMGCAMQGEFAYLEKLNRHRRIMGLYDKRPKINEDVFIAPSANIIGEVTLSKGTTVWYGAVLRGDITPIEIGAKSSIGNRVVIHVSSPNYRTGTSGATKVGKNVLVGDSAILHACTVEDDAVIESGAIVMDGAVVGKGSVISPGALVTRNKVIPPGQVWGGSPATYMQDVGPEEREYMVANVKRMYDDAKIHEEWHFKSEEDKAHDEVLEVHGRKYRFGVLPRDLAMKDTRRHVIEE